MVASPGAHQYFQLESHQRIRFSCSRLVVMPACLFQPETLKGQGAIHQAPIPAAATVEARVQKGVPEILHHHSGDWLSWTLSALPTSKQEASLRLTTEI